jgi:hypothetical protein
MMNKALILLFSFLLAGCSTAPKPVTFPVSPMMATSCAGGETIISWKTVADQNYTIYYTDAPPKKLPDWKPLPQGTKLQGTGKEITVSDKAGAGSVRRYLLLTGDQKPY